MRLGLILIASLWFKLAAETPRPALDSAVQRAFESFVREALPWFRLERKKLFRDIGKRLRDFRHFIVRKGDVRESITKCIHMAKCLPNGEFVSTGHLLRGITNLFPRGHQRAKLQSSRLEKLFRGFEETTSGDLDVIEIPKEVYASSRTTIQGTLETVERSAKRIPRAAVKMLATPQKFTLRFWQ
jgi:hypothetical protein